MLLSGRYQIITQLGQGGFNFPLDLVQELRRLGYNILTFYEAG